MNQQKKQAQNAASTKSVTFNHTVLQGTAYEAGKRQGDIVKDIPEALYFFSSGEQWASGSHLSKAVKQIEQLNPILHEEIHGFADSLHVPPEQIVFYAHSCLKAGRCSHLAVLPSITQDRHVLVGRSYEFSDKMDDLRLCTTRIEGNYAHIGFSQMLFGRMDGMNENGLSVTMSVGGLPIGIHPEMQPPVQDGVHFWVLLRTLLDQCRTVEEAVELARRTPLCCNLNLIVAHKSGTAALIEIVGPHLSVKTIDAAEPQPFLCATNHLTQPDMTHHIPTMMENSGIRHNTIASALRQAAPRVAKQTLRSLLAAPYPEGLRFHYYDEFFGTLWSAIYDLTETSAEICFGSPAANPWHIFDLSATRPPAGFSVQLPLEKAAPSFWRQVAVDTKTH